MGDEDGNKMAHTSIYGKRRVWLAWWGLEDIIPVLLPAGSEHVHAISVMVKPIHSWSSLMSRFIMMISLTTLCHVLNSTIA